MSHEILPKPVPPPETHRTSRARYHGFRKAYRDRKLDEHTDAAGEKKTADVTAPSTDNGDETPEAKAKHKVKRREYLREYGRWLWPYRYAVFVMFLLAIGRAG